MKDAACIRFAECGLATDRSRKYEDCTFELSYELNCGTVRALADGFDRCLDDLAVADCSSFPQTWPSSCKGVLLQ